MDTLRLAAERPSWEPPKMSNKSAVLEYGAAEPGEAATVMADKLRFHTDAWDLAVDLKSGHPEIVVIDARSRHAYAQAHNDHQRHAGDTGAFP